MTGTKSLVASTCQQKKSLKFTAFIKGLRDLDLLNYLLLIDYLVFEVLHFKF